MEYIVQTNHLCKYYKRTKALDGLDMHIPNHAIYGFVGKNGAGKTTLFRLLCGLHHPTKGDFEMFSVKNTDKGFAKARHRIGAVVENPAFYMDMTAKENLKQQYIMMGLPGFDGIDELLRIVGLEDAGRKKAKQFSLGMRQRLGIAIALCGEPDLLLLDEPINGLDPQGIIELRELLVRLNKEKGITILISSHILEELSKLATHYGFIERGRMLKEMSAEELEKSCRKCVRMTVEDTKVLARILDEMGIGYRVLDDHRAELYTELIFSEIAEKFSEERCRIISMEEQEESLESFYLSLVKNQGI